MPAQWMLYITVSNLDESLEQCAALGGTVVVPDGPADSVARQVTNAVIAKRAQLLAG